MCDQTSKKGRGVLSRPSHRCLVSLLVSVFIFIIPAEGAIGNGRQQTCGSCDLSAETSVGGVIGEKLLRALLAGASNDVEVRVEQQRVTGCNGVGDHAE